MFEYSNDGFGPAALMTQPRHGWTSKGTNSNQSVKIGVERNRDSATVHGRRQDLLILRLLHTKLGYMPALIAESTKQRR